MFDRARIVDALKALAADLFDHGLTGELFLVGGGAMALAYSNDRVTRDLDAVFEPKMLVYDAAKRVAGQLGLDDDWLNDAMKGFLHGEDPDATVLFEHPGLAVRIQTS